MARLPRLIRTRFCVLSKAQENKYFGKVSYFIMKLYAVYTHKNRLIEAILMSTLSIQLLCRNRNDFPKLSMFVSWPGAMITPQWLELAISRINFHGPKDDRAIDVRLYISLIAIWAARKRVFGHMRTAKAQISLRIRAVWSGPSLTANSSLNTIKCIFGEQIPVGDFVNT